MSEQRKEYEEELNKLRNELAAAERKAEQVEKLNQTVSELEIFVSKLKKDREDDTKRLNAQIAALQAQHEAACSAWEREKQRYVDEIERLKQDVARCVCMHVCVCVLCKEAFDCAFCACRYACERRCV
jgi:hypothetical protein